ncbi:hypothetical protein ACFVZH_16600 [Streptomyces sp. NPDC059534]|uniref:hypothetical protein n=1 Tax=Streptomyces sp. NPDC059534 TaxID=3346859 RepID=UPI0036AEBC8A
MARRGERRPRPRPTESKIQVPARQDRVGVRELSYVTPKGRTLRHRVDPRAYRCSTLAAQLADAWIDYHRAAALTSSDDYAGAVRSLAEFADRHLAAQGLDPAAARLDGGDIDLVEVIYEWEESLQGEYAASSTRPNVLAGRLLTLISHRATRDPDVPERLRRRAEKLPSFRRPKAEPFDEFANHERLAMRQAAQDGVRALEKRLARGRDLLEAGEDPRVAGWHELPNLVWAARHRILTTADFKEHLAARGESWPQPLKELIRGPGDFSRYRYRLLRAVHGLLFPTEIDLHPFRILLLLELTDCTPEELHVICEDDVAFSGEGVRVVQRKKRAARVRADFHPRNDVALEEGEAPGEWAYAGAGNWDIPGLMRRLHAATALSRDVFEQPWLFTAVEGDKHRAAMQAGLGLFTRTGRRFGDWIAAHDGADATPALDISRPHDVRRLRKTAKTSKVTALGGTLTDLAGDDHHIEVFRGHYAHGTTAHVLAGQAINRAQKQVFAKVTAKPVLITAEAEESLTEPETAQALDLTEDQAEALATGDLDMGLTGCRNPYDSPHTPEGKLCHVAPAMCMLCRNAIVFTSQLPRLLMLSDHIEQMRLVLAPDRWQAAWGRQAAALAEVFDECAEQIPAARQEIEDNKLRLDLPLGMRTEYER